MLQRVSLWMLLFTALIAARRDAPALNDRAARGLYAQATASMLDRDFPSPRIEYVLLDARSGEVIASRWPHGEKSIPPGSLLKPFVALAYERSKQNSVSFQRVDGELARSFPKLRCHGKADGCWRGGGHGIVGLEQALAVSCNAYFLALARELVASSRNALQDISAAYGLPSPPSRETAPMLIGVTPEWRIPPLPLARAYVKLTNSSGLRNPEESKSTAEDVEARLRDGMRMAALPGGTAARIGVHAGGVLAKTGTAPCVPESVDGSLRSNGNSERCRINGDGLVVLAAPAESPRWVLLVRESGTTGAMTAEVAGRMLTRLEEADDLGR